MSTYLHLHCPARWIAILVIVALLLNACTVEGGVPEVPATRPPAAQQPVPTDAAAQQRIAERKDTWMVGMLEQLHDLYPYQPTPTAQRVAAPILELLFPSPILAYNYGYTSTGILEQVPTLENGGATTQPVDVYLDAAGNITTTTTAVVTQVQQLVVTFRWNPQLRWSDGQPVTADDSLFAYELARAAPPNAEARDRLDQTVSYEKLDEHTTRVVLQPDYSGPGYFLHYWTPLPRHLLKDIAPDQLRSSPFAQQPVGYGPYAISKRPSGEIHMVINTFFPGPKPAASHLTIKQLANIDLARAGLLNGSLDLVATDRIPVEAFDALDGDAKEGAVQVSYVPNPIWEHIDFNLDVPPLKDIRVRRALAIGTNRQAMVDALFKGRSPVLESWVLPGQAEAAPLDQLTRYAYDPDQARKLLDEAGYTDRDGDGIRAGSDGLTLTLQLFTTNSPPLRQAVAEQFKADMQAIGVQVEINALPSEELFDPGGPLYQRQFELALFGWAAGPSAGGVSLWSCGAVPSEANGWSGENFAGWCFRDADRAIRTADSALDANERREDYLRQQQLWTQELPALPLFQRLSLVIAAPELQGLRPDAFAPITWNVSAWERGR